MILVCILNASYQAQMTLILRCVDTFVSSIKIEEYFLKFLKIDDTFENVFFDELIIAFGKHEFDIMDIRGQCYERKTSRYSKETIRYKF